MMFYALRKADKAKQLLEQEHTIGIFNFYNGSQTKQIP
jgi:hypothetical protein